MTTLDNPIDNLPNPSEVSPQSTIIRYGLIGGMILVVLTLLNFITGFGSPSSGFGMIAVFTLLTFGTYIAVMVLAVKHHRDNELGGYITLGRAFIVALLASIIMALINTVFTYLYMTVIDPGYIETLADQSRELYENMGMDEAAIDAALGEVKKAFTLTRQLLGLVIGSAFGAVIAIIIAAIMKKVRPNFA